MTELDSKIWDMTHRWCDAQHGAIPDQNRRYLMDEIKALVLSHVSGSLPTDKEIETWATYECGGCSQESNDELL